MQRPTPRTRGRDHSADRSTRAVLAVCDAAGAFIEWWGFKSIQGRVWTLVALHSGPMTQTSIASTLGVSRSLVCSAIAELADLGLVRPVGDHRNAPWEAVIDVWPVISDVLRQREWLLIEQARIALEAALEEIRVAEDAGEEVPWDRGRLQALLSLTDMAQRFMKLILSLRSPLPEPTREGWLDKASEVIRRLRLAK